MFRSLGSLFDLGGFEFSQMRYWKKIPTFKSYKVKLQMTEIKLEAKNLSGSSTFLASIFGNLSSKKNEKSQNAIFYCK